jgi:hypothetical protein
VTPEDRLGRELGIRSICPAALLTGLALLERTAAMTAPPTHRCPPKGCTRQVRDDLLMCGEHWRMVPVHLQRAVWAAWRRGAGRGDGELVLAQAAAIEAVDALLGANTTEGESRA